ncbi:MAG: hypothetical protein AAF623_21205 [Planctomycetota bacterium]
MRSKLILCLTVLNMITLCSLADAQTERRKFLQDYRDDRPFQYQPSDPFVRSKIFKTHIGHGGLFYNCDGEENKRCSPYICWKIHDEYDLPPRQPFFRMLRCEIDEIKQRIIDGAGPCYDDSCGCDDCQQASSHSAYAAETAAKTRSDIASRQNSATKLRNETQTAQRYRFGKGVRSWQNDKQVEAAQEQQSVSVRMNVRRPEPRTSNVPRTPATDSKRVAKVERLQPKTHGLISGKLVNELNQTEQSSEILRTPSSQSSDSTTIPSKELGPSRR